MQNLGPLFEQDQTGCGSERTTEVRWTRGQIPAWLCAAVWLQEGNLTSLCLVPLTCRWRDDGSFFHTGLLKGWHEIMNLKSLTYCLAQDKLRGVQGPLAFAYAVPSTGSTVPLLYVSDWPLLWEVALNCSSLADLGADSSVSPGRLCSHCWLSCSFCH